MKCEPDMASVDVVDFPGKDMIQKSSTVGILNCELSCKRLQKDCGKKVLKAVINKLRLKKFGSATISRPDPVYKVSYLGNVVTGWAKGEGCVEKPLATLWRNYTQSSRPDVHMQLSVSGGGLKATTKDHGLTEYWANRLTFCSAPTHFPRIFCWIYRHEGRKLRHELRCHAVLCSSATVARQIEEQLKAYLALALAEFRKDKISRQNARLSLINSLYEYPTIPRRKILLSCGSHNYKPPLERSKSAPKLTIIEENADEEDEVGEYKRRCFFQSLSNPTPPPTDCIINNSSNEDDKASQNQICDVLIDDSRKPDHQINLLESNILAVNDLMYDGFSEELVEEKWFSNLGELPVDSDDGSLTSGCETSSSVTSEAEPTHFSTIIEVEEDKITYSTEEGIYDNGKGVPQAELNFKVGGSVHNFEQQSEMNLRKYCWINGLNRNTSGVPNNDQVSLVPLGECQTDFSSLKVFKRKHSENCILENGLYEIKINGENDKNCDLSDEGYEEAVDCPHSTNSVII